MEKWRFLPYHTYSAAENMAIDEAIMMLFHQEKIPTLRFYGWDVPTVSIGYFQKACAVNREYVSRKGMGFVRRLTGGRAVLHDQELTYSFVIAKDHPLMASSICMSYHKISYGLFCGFQNLGLQTTFAPNGKRCSSRSSACFDAPSTYEVLVAGKKVVGSAQIRKQGVLLQHGSILLDWDVDVLLQCLVFASEEEREEVREELVKKAVPICQVATSPVKLNSVVRAFYEGFEKGFGVSFEEGRLTKAEEELVKELVDTRYRNDAWNGRR